MYVILCNDFYYGPFDSREAADSYAKEEFQGFASYTLLPLISPRFPDWKG